ncbi:hypothetical protein [Ferrovum myxofaciens]
MNDQSSQSSSFKRIWEFNFVTLITTLIQFLCVAYTFPVSELLSNQPFFHIDSAFHWYQMQLAADIAPSTIGYDPFFAAGYPGGVTINLSAHVPALLAILLTPKVSIVVIYKCYVFVCAILGPACVSLAASLLRLSFRHTALAGFLALILWWASIFHWYHTAGMVSFVMASFVALPFSAAIYQYLESDENGWTLIVLGITGGIIFFSHPLFPIPIVFFTLSYVCTSWSRISFQRLTILILVVSGISLIPNLFWLIPMFHYSGDPSIYLKVGQPYQKIVDANLLWRELIGQFRGNTHGAKIYAPIFIGAVYSSLFSRNRSMLKIAQCLTLSGFIILLFAATGASISVIGNLQPNRFSPVGYLFLIIPATIGYYDAIHFIKERHNFFSKSFITIGVAIVVTTTSYASYEMVREIGYGHWGHYGFPPPGVRGIGEYSKWILNFLEKQTNTQGRILFELSSGRIYDDAHMTGYYAYTSDREFIGGSYPYFHFTNFQDGLLFGHPINQLSKSRFLDYMRIYNVGWILVHSEISKKYLDSIPTLKVVGEYKEFKAYQINQALSFFTEGKGNIKARSHNLIVLSDLQGGVVTLKYHYFPGILSSPHSTILPKYMLDDPTPFISITNPPKDMTLSLQ